MKNADSLIDAFFTKELIHNLNINQLAGYEICHELFLAVVLFNDCTRIKNEGTGCLS
jgi:hypothetical protein